MATYYKAQRAETDAYAGKLYYAEVLKERVRFLVF